MEPLSLDTPLFAVLRYNRVSQLKDQILFETNLHEVLIYINNYLNYSIVLKLFYETRYSIYLNIKMTEEYWNPSAIPITIIYHIYCKIIKTLLVPQPLLIF